jgi:hypothetical protein
MKEEGVIDLIKQYIIYLNHLLARLAGINNERI